MAFKAGSSGRQHFHRFGYPVPEHCIITERPMLRKRTVFTALYGYKYLINSILIVWYIIDAFAYTDEAKKLLF